MPNNNEVSLSDLANGAVPTATPVGMPTRLDPSKVSDVNMSEVALPSKADDPVAAYSTGNPILDKALGSLDGTTERLASESEKLIKDGEEERLEAALESSEAADIDAIEENTSNTIHVQSFDDAPAYQPQQSTAPAPATEQKSVTVVKTVQDPVETVKTEVVETAAPVSGTVKKEIKLVPEDDDDDLFTAINIDDEDMGFLDEDEKQNDESSDEDDKTEEIKQNIRQEMAKNFRPVANQLDLSKFTIAKKPIAAAKVINSIKNKPIECADSVLYDLDRPIRMSAWGPLEIQSINPQNVQSGNYNAFVENKMRLAYEHIIDANKPKSFESWAMSTPNTVMDDLMFAAYKATFGNANMVTFNCSDDNCQHVFIESVPISSMIKFRNDEVKQKYYDILHHGNVDSTSQEYSVDLYQASDEYVFGLKTPSLYNTYIETSLIDRAFAEKYNTLLLLLTYIDDAYLIDKETNTLIPIDTKPIATDKVTTYKRRVKTFAAILKHLTSDQLQALSVETDKYDMTKLDDNNNPIKNITYVFPECRCKKCGKKIDEVEVAPDNMLFTRHQLGLMSKI